MTARTIVVIDDEPHIRHVISRKLERAGYEVRTASDGAEGLELIRAEKPCLLITDLKMPRVDGLQVCAACRQNPDTRKLPIILVTGSVMMTAEIQSRIGAFDNICCISKPFSPRQLLQKARELVEPATPEAS